MRSARPRSALSQKMRRARHFLKNMRRARHFRKKERGEGARSALLQMKLNIKGSKNKISSDPAFPSPQRGVLKFVPGIRKKARLHSLSLSNKRRENTNINQGMRSARPRSALSQKMRHARHFLKNMRRARHFRKKERGERGRARHFCT